MTDLPAAADDCEHHYETRILGGHPLTVRACTFCRTPDWADLREQAAGLYRWGWQEGRDGEEARETLSAYGKPRAEPSDPVQCSGDEGFCTEHGFHRHSLKQPGEQSPRTTLNNPPTSRESHSATADNPDLHTALAAAVRATFPGTSDAHIDELADALLPVAAAPLQQLRDQLAGELAKARAADLAVAQRPDRSDFLITPHNGIASGLETAVYLVDCHLREAGCGDGVKRAQPRARTH